MRALIRAPLLRRRKLLFPHRRTLFIPTYKILEEHIVELFREHWPQIATGRCDSRKQSDGGSFHKNSDKAPFVPLIEEKGWFTPVADLIGKAKTPAE